jgi:chemotaxis protein methyltransferase CheR
MKEQIMNSMIFGQIPVASPAKFDALDYEAFARGVQTRFGVHLGEYRIDQMQRRLRTLAEARGHKTFAAFLQELQVTPEALKAFLDTMTINVTELLRNPERFGELTESILPGLLASRKPEGMSVWSAGCSYGAEAYTVAMLLHEQNAAGTHRIRGTDIDRAVLAKANTACFCEQDMQNISPARRAAHFLDRGVNTPDVGPLAPRYSPLAHLRSKVQFCPHDLLVDPFPSREYDLILCRNVLIYFTDAAKDRIYRGFFQALRPGGVLFVGGTERLQDHRAIGFESLKPFFYRRP